ncbi:MAG: hypothetical protein JNJ93_02770 [Acinetobacter sp.]|nr:hypothetical protein [Acinetobacter sp.]
MPNPLKSIALKNAILAQVLYFWLCRIAPSVSAPKKQLTALAFMPQFLKNSAEYLHYALHLECLCPQLKSSRLHFQER